MGNPLIMSDERLDQLAEIYLANPIMAQQHVTFEMFLYNPGMMLLSITELQLDQIDACIAKMEQGYLALLPEQRAVRDRLDAEEAIPPGIDKVQPTGPTPVQVRNNGRLIEPLAHHRRARGDQRRYANWGAQ